MRVLIAVLFSVLVLGGIGAYIRFADSITPRPPDLSEPAARGEYAMDVTLTFDAKVSLFSAVEPFSLQIRFRDRVLYESQETIKAGTPMRIENIPDVKAGNNEFWVYASPGDFAGDENSFEGFDGADVNAFQGFEETGDADTAQADAALPAEQIMLDRAIRLRIFRDSDPVPIAEKTLWSDQNGAVQGAIDLFVEPPASSE